MLLRERFAHMMISWSTALPFQRPHSPARLPPRHCFDSESRAALAVTLGQDRFPSSPPAVPSILLHDCLLMLRPPWGPCLGLVVWI